MTNHDERKRRFRKDYHELFLMGSLAEADENDDK